MRLDLASMKNELARSEEDLYYLRNTIQELLYEDGTPNPYTIDEARRICNRYKDKDKGMDSVDHIVTTSTDTAYM